MPLFDRSDLVHAALVTPAAVATRAYVFDALSIVQPEKPAIPATAATVGAAVA